jgi:uncharacterized tellurite resistance protein B-like protein
MAIERGHHMAIRKRAKRFIIPNLKKRLIKRLITDSVSQEKDKFERIHVATSILLLEVAESDDEFSSIEKATISSILKKEFPISGEAVEELMEIAKSERDESVGLWEFTNLINENYSTGDKIKVIEAAWRVIYADKKLDMYEDHLVHKLAKLLRLEHEDLIASKLRVLDEINP